MNPKAETLTKAMFRALDAHERGAAEVIHQWLPPHAAKGCPFCEEKK